MRDTSSRVHLETTTTIIPKILILTDWYVKKNFPNFGEYPTRKADIRVNWKIQSLDVEQKKCFEASAWTHHPYIFTRLVLEVVSKKAVSR